MNSLEGAGTISGLLAVQVVGGAVGGGDLNYAYLYDANGNVGQLVDWAHDPNDPNGALVAKYEYDPYGGVTAATGSYAADNVWRFSTKQFDAETGLGYWGYRYYSPTLGRWINRDPIGERGGTNVYAYVRNHPQTGVDGAGLAEIDPRIINETTGDGRSICGGPPEGDTWYRSPDLVDPGEPPVLLQFLKYLLRTGGTTYIDDNDGAEIMETASGVWDVLQVNLNDAYYWARQNKKCATTSEYSFDLRGQSGQRTATGLADLEWAVIIGQFRFSGRAHCTIVRRPVDCSACRCCCQTIIDCTARLLGWDTYDFHYPGLDVAGTDYDIRWNYDAHFSRVRTVCEH